MIPAILLVLAQVAPPAAAPVDLLAERTFAQAWLWAQSIRASDADKRDLAGGRLQAQAGLGHWGVTVRLDASGLPGEFVQDKTSTFRTVEGYIAGHLNLFAVPEGKASCGPAALAGGAVSLDRRNGETPAMPGVVTAGVGARCGGAGWAGYVTVGTHQALPGLAAVVALHLEMSSKTAFVADGGVGRDGAVYARLGFAVRLW